MARHIVLEIDEGSISLTLAEIRKRRLEVLESREVRIPSLEGSALVFGIHDVLKGLDKEGALVHVALSDQNFLHFDINVPKLDTKALEAVLTREARRLGSFGEDQRVLLGYRRLEKVGKAARRYAVVALPEQALRPVVSALAREGLTLGMVTSVEEAAVRLLPRQLPGAVLLLDYGASRVRFVYIEHGVVTQRRHILVPGLEQDSMVGDHWVGQLAMEIGWNLDYLKEMGKPEPQLMVLSLNLQLDDERRRALACGLPIHPGLEPVVPGGEILLGQATQGMLRSLLDGDGMSVLGGMAREARKRQGSRRPRRLGRDDAAGPRRGGLGRAPARGRRRADPRAHRPARAARAAPHRARRRARAHRGRRAARPAAGGPGRSPADQPLRRGDLPARARGRVAGRGVGRGRRLAARPRPGPRRGPDRLARQGPQAAQGAAGAAVPRRRPGGARALRRPRGVADVPARGEVEGSTVKLPRLIVQALLVLVPAAAGSLLGLSLLDLEREHGEARALDQAVGGMQARVLELEQARALEDKVDELPRLCPEPDIASFLGELEHAARRAEVRCDEVEVPRSETEGEQGYVLGGEGSATAIARFLAIVEANHRLPVVQSCRVFGSAEGTTRFALRLRLCHKLAGGPR
ncbi:MAG: hypothetical protein R3F30_04920 [Planctomycetota bacterium]